MTTKRLMAILAALVSTSAMPEEKGIVGKYEEDGLPVIVSFVDELPATQIRNRYPWLTVVSWRYDGADRNGMPPERTNEKMLSLQWAIDESLVETDLCLHAYSRTGNNLKELVYYVRDRDEFMSHFNTALAGHPRYPIEINFYEDLEWKDFQQLQSRFREKH